MSFVLTPDSPPGVLSLSRSAEVVVDGSDDEEQPSEGGADFDAGDMPAGVVFAGGEGVDWT